MNTKKNIVTLRESLSKFTGVTSLYLDYTINGRRKKTYLGIYLNNGKDSKTKADNVEKRRIAELKRAEFEKDILLGKIDIVAGSGRADKIKFIDYIRKAGQSKGTSTNTYTNYNTIISFAEKYGLLGRTLQHTDTADINKFLAVMEEAGLKESTRYQYFATIRAVLNRAVKEELIRDTPIKHIDNKPKKQEAHREYLTKAELESIKEYYASTENKAHRRFLPAFIFSCYTGLRYSDIVSLTAKDIKDNGIRKSVEITMKKTQEIVSVPISAKALPYIDLTTEGRIYGNMQTLRQINGELKQVATACNIDKTISFHTARHSFATIMCTEGVDIYTISKLLGHRKIETTQIYAEIVNGKKEQAIDLL